MESEQGRACLVNAASRYDERGTGGRAAEGTGLLNRWAAGPHIDENTDGADKSDDGPDLDSVALAPRLRKHPDLAELVDVWVLLDEPIRQAILTLARGSAREGQR